MTEAEFALDVMQHVTDNPGHSVTWQVEFDPWTASCLSDDCGWAAEQPAP